MSKVVMLVGIPGSGKSNYGKELSLKENAIMLSSDALRKELFGNINHQDNNGELFQELHMRAKKNLNNGCNVIVDATNINQKRRISFVNDFKNYETECHYLDTPLSVCLLRDKIRTRTVGFEVIDRMYRSLQIPTMSEGWNKIKYIHHGSGNSTPSLKQHLESCITQNLSYKDLFDNKLIGLDIFMAIRDLPHDSSYHSLSVSRHTYHVWKYILDNYHSEDKIVMLWAALLHDVGKKMCKSFKEGSRYANFIGHENVSSQLACNFLSGIGYDDEFIMRVVELVQLHMRLLNRDQKPDATDKLRKFVGEDVFNKLLILRDADTAAH